mmetsp:Transcript_6605/g.22055  ORF Transcript_6605/g.22055 Transcript_6605/m.22055 type:complete len:207 (+) Transcript_6605:134-754(+)
MSRMLHARLDVGALLSALAVLVRPGGRCLLVGNAGPGGVAAAVVKASRRYPPGAWRVVRQTACASGGIACEAVQLARLGEAAPRLGRLEKARGKVVLEPGFGLAAWLRLSRGADLTGGVGPLDEEEEEAWPKWSLADVASHTTPEDSWMAVRGKVYNVSPYLRYHPGGADTLLDAAGTDATALFQQHHAWVNEDMLSACCVGTLRQ